MCGNIVVINCPESNQTEILIKYDKNGKTSALCFKADYKKALAEKIHSEFKDNSDYESTTEEIFEEAMKCDIKCKLYCGKRIEFSDTLFQKEKKLTDIV